MPKSENSTKKRCVPWARIALLCMLVGTCLFVAGWLSGSRGGYIYFNNGLQVVPIRQVQPLQGRETIEMPGNITSLFLNTGSAAVELIPSDVLSISIPSQLGHNHTISGNNLNVYTHMPSQQGRRSGIGASLFSFNLSVNPFSSRQHTVRVYVPQNVTAINARSTSGSITILDGINTQSLSLTSNSGRIDVRGGQHVQTRLQATSGNIGVVAYLLGDTYANANSGNIAITCQSAGSGTNLINATVRTTSGNISISGINTHTIDVRANSGSINLRDGQHQNVNFRTTSGAIRMDAYMLGIVNAQANSGAISIIDRNTSLQNAIGNLQIYLRTTSGRINYSTSLPLEEFAYNVNVTSGNIHIGNTRHTGRNAIGGNTAANAPSITARANSGSVNLLFN